MIKQQKTWLKFGLAFLLLFGAFAVVLALFAIIDGDQNIVNSWQDLALCFISFGGAITALVLCKREQRLGLCLGIAFLILSLGYIVKYFAFNELNASQGSKAGLVNNLTFYFGFIVLAFAPLAILMFVAHFVPAKVLKIIAYAASIAIMLATTIILIILLVSDLSFMNAKDYKVFGSEFYGVAVGFILPIVHLITIQGLLVSSLLGLLVSVKKN